MQENMIRLTPISYSYLTKFFPELLANKCDPKQQSNAIEQKLNQHLSVFGDDLTGTVNALKSIINDLIPELIIKHDEDSSAISLCSTDFEWRCHFLEILFSVASNDELASSLDPNKYNFDPLLKKLLDDGDSKLVYYLVDFIADIFSSEHFSALFQYTLSSPIASQNRLDYVLLKNASRNRKFLLWVSNFWLQIKEFGENNKKLLKFCNLSPEFVKLFSRSISELSQMNALKVWKDFNANFNIKICYFLKLFSLFLSHCHITVWNENVEKIFRKTMTKLKTLQVDYDEYYEVLYELITLKLRLLPVGALSIEDDCSIFDLTDILDGLQPQINEDNEARMLLFNRMAFIKYKFLQICSFNPKRPKELSKIVDFIVNGNAFEPELIRELLPEIGSNDLHRLMHIIVESTDSRVVSLINDIQVMSDPKIQTCLITVFIKSLAEKFCVSEPGTPQNQDDSFCKTLKFLSQNEKIWFKHADRPPNPADPEMEKVVQKLNASTEAMLDESTFPNGGRVLKVIQSRPAYSMFWNRFPIEYLTRLNQTRLLIVLTWLSNHIFVHWNDIVPSTASATPDSGSRNKKSSKSVTNSPVKDDIVDFLACFLDVNFRIFGGSRGVWFYEFLSPEVLISRLIFIFARFDSLVADRENLCTKIYKLLNIYVAHLYRHQQDAEMREKVCKQVHQCLKNLAQNDKHNGRESVRQEDGSAHKKKRKIESSLPEGTLTGSRLGKLCLLILQTQNGKFLARKSPPEARKAFEKLDRKLCAENRELLDELSSSQHSLSKSSVLLSTIELFALRGLFEQKLSQKTNAETEVEWLKLLDKIVTNIVNNTPETLDSANRTEQRPFQTGIGSVSKLEFITFALCNRSQAIQSQISAVQVFQQIVDSATPTFCEDHLKKLFRRIRRPNNWIKIYSQPGSYEKFYNDEQSLYLLPKKEHDSNFSQSFVHAHSAADASGALLSVIAMHSTIEEFEQILQLCLNLLQKNDWTITFHVVQLMNGLFGTHTSSSSTSTIIKIEQTKAELLQNQFFAPFLERFQNLTALVSKPNFVLSTPALVRSLPKALVQLTRGLIMQLLGNSLLTDFNVYQCHQLITETRCVNFHKDSQIFGELFLEISQLLSCLVQQRPHLVISMKSSLNAVLVHLLACLLKAGSRKNLHKTQQKSGIHGTEDALKKCIVSFANTLKNLCHHKEFMSLAWPIIVQYLELSSRISTTEQIKLELNQTIFPLFNLLRKHQGTDGLQPLFARLSEQSRALFNIVYEHYQQYYNYQGQV